MPPIVLSYPCHEPSKRPRPMTAWRIWQVAWAAREQLFGRVVVEAVDADELMRRCRRFRVNGVSYTAIWAREASLADGDGRPALGLCDYDDASPEQIMISLNGGLLEGHPQVAATTAAHEIGHAVFDRPADVREGRLESRAETDCRQIASRTSTNASLVGPVAPKPGAMDWPEFRANEFMGGFMVPPRLLHKRLLAYAGEAGLPLVEEASHHGVNGLPVLRRSSSVVTDLLAEDFGVGAVFIEVRLAKYRLVANWAF